MTNHENKLSEMIAAALVDGITVEIAPKLGTRDGWDIGAKHYQFTIRKGANSYSGDYSQGSGIKRSPTGADILAALICDASCYCSVRGIVEFAAEYGYHDSKTAQRAFNGCKEASANLRRIIGSRKVSDMINAENDF